MSNTIIITLCSLILVAYVFNITSFRTKIPPVILLLILGWGVRQVLDFIEIVLPDFTFLLPVLGTVGLILIVLEGTLELELNRSKISVIKKSFFGALIPMLVTALIFALILHFIGGSSFRNNLLNILPLCIISSAIAIPSVKNLSAGSQEFILYESSFSDILGVLFFTFLIQNRPFTIHTAGFFSLQVLLILLIAFIATVCLTFLLNKIKHHIKFIPIIVLVILIYSISEVYHLPGLIFILIFGLFIGNIKNIEYLKRFKSLKPDILRIEVQKFRELVIEASFLLRVLFFLLFGYLLETSEIINSETLLWTFGIVLVIFLIRAVQLKLSDIALNPALFIAPRGLITILLFLTIDPAQSILFINSSVIIQVIILTALVMMFGLLLNKEKNKPGGDFEYL